MKLIRMFTGPDERSHLEELSLDLAQKGDPAESVLPRILGGPGYVRVSSSTLPELHPAPRHQYLVVLEGELDVIVGDGQQMPVTPGDIIQVEDTSGEGHVLRFRNNCQRYVFFFAPIAP